MSGSGRDNAIVPTTPAPANAGIRNNPIAIVSRSNGIPNCCQPGTAQEHGTSLQETVSRLAAQWKQQMEQSQEQGAPLPAAMPLLIQADRNLLRQKDSLKACGIEVVTKLDEGYLLGTVAAADVGRLQDKIELFLNEERGGNKISGIWEILDAQQRLQYILLPGLLAQWQQLKPSQLYTVDLGIACARVQSQLPDFIEQQGNETESHYLQRLNRWQQKRDRQLREWDSLHQSRLQELEIFIGGYGGSLVSEVKGSARLPDSFSCRICISGAGLKALVNLQMNFRFPSPPLFDHG